MDTCKVHYLLQAYISKMAFSEHSVPRNQSPSSDKTFTDRWGNWRTGSGLDLGLETEFLAICDIVF